MFEEKGQIIAVCNRFIVDTDSLSVMPLLENEGGRRPNPFIAHAPADTTDNKGFISVFGWNIQCFNLRLVEGFLSLKPPPAWSTKTDSM